MEEYIWHEVNEHAQSDTLDINSFAKLKTELSRFEMTAALTQPIKETLTAGKTLIDAGQMMGRWITSFWKSN